MSTVARDGSMRRSPIRRHRDAIGPTDVCSMLAGGYLAGLALVGWIVVQLLVLQHFFFLQPVVAVLGLAEIVLAWLWQRARDRRPGQNRDLRP